MVYVRREADSMPPGILPWDGRAAVRLRSGYAVAGRGSDSSEETA